MVRKEMVLIILCVAFTFKAERAEIKLAPTNESIGERLDEGVNVLFQSTRPVGVLKTVKDEDLVTVSDGYALAELKSEGDGYSRTDKTKAFWSKNTCVTVAYCVEHSFKKYWARLKELNIDVDEAGDMEIDATKDAKDKCAQWANKQAQEKQYQDLHIGCGDWMKSFMTGLREELLSKYYIDLYADFEDAELIAENTKWKQLHSPEEKEKCEQQQLDILKRRVTRASKFGYFTWNSGAFCDAEKEAAKAATKAKRTSSYFKMYQFKVSKFNEEFDKCLKACACTLNDMPTQEINEKEKSIGKCMAKYVAHSFSGKDSKEITH